jgi:hypothetical protein
MLQCKAFHLDGKRTFKTLENLSNMNLTTFISTQFDTKHFKHAMNTIVMTLYTHTVYTYMIRGCSLKYLSNVNSFHFEYDSLKGSSNLHKDRQLHVT